MVKMKRGLALLLALMMLLGMMSISAMAFEGFDEEASEIPAGEEVMEAVEASAVEIAEIPVVAPVAVPAAAGEKAAAVDKSTMPSGVKVIGWVSSDLNKGGTTIVKGTVFDNYNAELVIPKGDAKVNPGNAQIGVAMQNVSSLGVTGFREHHISIKTGLKDSNGNPMDIPLEGTLNGFFGGEENNKLFAFTRATVNATINGKAVTYALADKSDASAKKITATPTAKADAQAAWQEIAGAVKSSTQVNEDSYILVKGGSWLQLGGEVLCFEKAGDLKVDGQDANLVANIKKMVTVMDAKDPSKVAFALKKGTQLAVGATVAELTKDVVVSATVTNTNADKKAEIDAKIAGLKVLSTMRAAANSSDLGAAEIIKTLLGFMNTAIGLVDGNVMNVTVETVAAAPEAPVKYHIGAGEKFKVWVSSDLNAGGKTTVTGTVFDNYNAELVLPEANVNPSNVTVGIAMQNVGSLNVTDPREYSISIETGLKYSNGNPIGDMPLENTLNFLGYDGLFNFAGGKIIANINGKAVTYTLANKPDENAKKITATTDYAAAQAAWQEMTNYVSAGTKAEDSFIVIPNGSWLQLGKQVLCFEDTGDVTVDNIASLNVAGIKSKVQVVPAYDSKVAFVLKKGAKLAVGSSIAELTEDVYVTVTPKADKNGVVDNLTVLSDIRDAANGGSFDARSLVFKLLECMDKAVKLIDGSEITVDMTFAADAPKAPVALTVKVLADKNLYTVGTTGIVFDKSLRLEQDDNGIYQVGVQVKAPKGITARIWDGDAWADYDGEILYTAITPEDVGANKSFVTKAWEFDVDGDGKMDQTVQVSLDPDTKLSLAKVGDTQYFDLSAAVAAAQDSVITLLRDVTAYDVAGLDGVKVNFNGKTINGKGGEDLTECRTKDGDVYTLYTAHKYDMNNPVADTATCEKDGLLTYKCVRCGHQDGTFGHNKLKHDMVAVTGQPASAASAGWIDHWRCTRVCCKDKFFVMGEGGAYVEAAWSQIRLTYTAPSNPPTPPTPSTPAETEDPGEVEDLDEEEVPLSELPLPFVDVAATDWSREAIAFVYSNDLMVGMGTTGEGVVFAPKTGLNRGGIVTLLYNLEKNPAIVTKANFVDVAAGQWYSDAVAWGVEAGLVNGYNDGTFGALDICTREQMFTLFYRYAMKKGLVDVFVKGDLTQFSDADAISGYAVEALEWAVGTGLVKGYNDGTLGPKNTITREQMAMFMLNFCETFMKNEDGKIVL